jgi:type VI secretion system protein
MATGLLAKMAALDRGDTAATERQSVIAHLSLMLNSRKDCSTANRHFGMPDFTEAVHNFPMGIVSLQRMIADLIQRYEPRLKNVSVRPVDLSTEQLVLSFEVRAQLHNGSALTLHTRLSRGGRISIS